MSVFGMPEGIIYAPFTLEQQVQFNRSQAFGHGYTCANHSSRLLVAVDYGLVCSECEYTQKWMSAWQANRAYLDSLVEAWQW